MGATISYYRARVLLRSARSTEVCAVRNPLGEAHLIRREFFAGSRRKPAATPPRSAMLETINRASSSNSLALEAEALSANNSFYGSAIGVAHKLWDGSLQYRAQHATNHQSERLQVTPSEPMAYFAPQNLRPKQEKGECE